jgi:hypothetical protein
MVLGNLGRTGNVEASGLGAAEPRGIAATPEFMVVDVMAGQPNSRSRETRRSGRAWSCGTPLELGTTWRWWLGVAVAVVLKVNGDAQGKQTGVSRVGQRVGELGGPGR